MNPSRDALGAARRIVVKLGTGVVTHAGEGIALGRLHTIVEDLATLAADGHQVLLVSSGSVSMGAQRLGLATRPRSLGMRQACAAIGQGQLLSAYARAFDQLGLTVAQVLLTQEDLEDRDRALCLRTTLLRLLDVGAVPVLNENDSVSVRELIEHRGESAVGFGDNDGLSARVAVAIDADVLVLLTDVDGLHTDNPTLNPDAQRIADRVGIDASTLESARGGSTTGTGGMASKLVAAKLATDAGIPTAILSGDAPGCVRRLLGGEDLGTVVWPEPAASRPARKRSVMHAEHRGALVVNDGALEALTSAKASLLPVGITTVHGEFVRGDVVEIRDGSGRVFGRGWVNYPAVDIRKICGRRSDELFATLGYRGYDEVITRDNLVINLAINLVINPVPNPA